MTELVLRNRQRTRNVNSPLLRRVTSVLLTDLLLLERSELAIHLVAAPEMARVNQQFLDHAGSTDVITFDYSFPMLGREGDDGSSSPLRNESTEKSSFASTTPLSKRDSFAPRGNPSWPVTLSMASSTWSVTMI